VDLEEREDSTACPLLSGEVLYVHVARTAAGAAMGCYSDGACVVFFRGGGAGNRETQVSENLSEVFNNLAGIATCDNLGFSGGQSCRPLNSSFGKYDCAAEQNHDTGDGLRVSQNQQSAVRCVDLKDGFQKGVSGGEKNIRGRFRANGDEVAAGEVGTLFSCRTPVDESSFAGAAKVAHDRLGSAKLDSIRSVVVLAKDIDGGGDVNTSYLNGEDQHSGEAAIFEANLVNNKPEGIGVKRTRGLRHFFDR
jgi:hypothetical protein